MTRRPDADRIERALNDPGNRFIKWRLLEDGTYVAMIQLMFTIAIVMDVDAAGYASRFCFDDTARAYLEFDKLVSGEDEPTGWIARR